MNRQSLSLALAGLATLPVALYGCSSFGGSGLPMVPNRIVFVSDKDQLGNTEIYSKAYNGSAYTIGPAPLSLDDATRLTTTPPKWRDQSPSLNSPVHSYAPNQDRIVFQSDRPNTINTEGGQNAIWKLDPAGNTTQLTFPPDSVEDTSPMWSPSGKKIAFVRGEGASHDIYVLDTTLPASATNPLQITRTGDDLSSAWSPDGSRLVFSSNRVTGGTDYNIYTADSTALESNVSASLTSNTGPDESPQWYPGTEILFQSKATPTSPGIIYTMPFSGAASGLTQQTSGSTDDGWPRYSPYANFIVFHRLSSGNRQIIAKKLPSAPGVGETQLNTAIPSGTGLTQPFWN